MMAQATPLTSDGRQWTNRQVRMRSDNPVGEVILRDNNQECVGHFYFLRLGRFCRLQFHDGGRIELVFGLAYTYRHVVCLRRERASRHDS